MRAGPKISSSSSAAAATSLPNAAHKSLSGISVAATPSGSRMAKEKGLTLLLVNHAKNAKALIEQGAFWLD